MKKVNPQETSQQIFQMTICVMIVCLMCPIMSLIATLLFQNAGNQVIVLWLQAMFVNFPITLGWQLFFGGTAVRKLEKICIYQSF